MKRSLLVACLFILFAAPLFAQNQNFQFSVGPYVMPKFSVNVANIQDGRKTGVEFTGVPDIGATVYMPLTANAKLGAMLDLGIHSFAFTDRDQADNPPDNLVNTIKGMYFVIAPVFNFSVMTAGINFGIPLSVSNETKAGTVVGEGSSDNLNTLIELRLGAVIPLYEATAGRLNLNITAGYMLSGFFADGPATVKGTTNFTGDLNPTTVSLAFGFSFYFNVFDPFKE